MVAKVREIIPNVSPNAHVKGGEKLNIMWRQRDVPDGSEIY